MPSLRNKGITSGVAGAIYLKIKKDFGVGLKSWESKRIQRGLVWGGGGERGEEL